VTGSAATYGPQELFKFPARGRKVDLATGVWGIWMPGFMQFVTGLWLMYLTWAVALNLAAGFHLRV
jgi:hypothetical protein